MWHELTERMPKFDIRNPDSEHTQLSSNLSALHPNGASVENSILQGLPDPEYEALLPSLEFVEFGIHQILQEPGESLEFGYFINTGLVSLLVVTSDARSVEVGIVCREGCVGAPLALGLRNSSQRALTQASGTAFRITAESLRNLLARAPVLRERIGRYVVLQGLQVGQLAACNRLHEVEQRLARWLLMTHDRAGGDALPITHDLLAQMLGSGRPSVTLAAGMLQRAGSIAYTRGQITVLDRKALEHSACECYGAIQRFSSGAFEI